jgi:hypothetical protein
MPILDERLISRVVICRPPVPTCRCLAPCVVVGCGWQESGRSPEAVYQALADHLLYRHVLTREARG